MTFSIIGNCERTGMFGVAITTSSISVGARCPWVRAGVGAVATQNVTHPGLGNRLLDLLEQGCSAEAALAQVVAEHEHIAWRQLSVVDRHGATAGYTGGNTLGVNALAEGRRCVGAGNLLANTGVPAAMVRFFESGGELHLAARLLGALSAGLAAGGEKGEVRSAALLVADQQSFPLVDLRVDWDEQNPVETLATLWHAYEPQMLDYLVRAVNPDDAPSYGVPGDP